MLLTKYSAIIYFFKEEYTAKVDNPNKNRDQRLRDSLREIVTSISRK